MQLHSLAREQRADSAAFLFALLRSFSLKHVSLRAEFEDQVTDQLMNRQLCSNVVYKEMFLSPDQIAGRRQCLLLTTQACVASQNPKLGQGTCLQLSPCLQPFSRKLIF